MISPPSTHSPNAFSTFNNYWETIATPFQWRFTRQDLARLLQKCRPTLKTAA